MANLQKDIRTQGSRRCRISHWRSAAIPGAIMTPSVHRLADVTLTLLRERSGAEAPFWTSQSILDGSSGAIPGRERMVEDRADHGLEVNESAFPEKGRSGISR